MTTEERIRALLERYAYIENGEQMQCMNVNEVDGLVAELAELVDGEVQA
jgi:hypothetical protein